jgi:hypothetical protein
MHRVPDREIFSHAAAQRHHENPSKRGSAVAPLREKSFRKKYFRKASLIL